MGDTQHLSDKGKSIFHQMGAIGAALLRTSDNPFWQRALEAVMPNYLPPIV
jgi:hypothetical protein